MNSTELAEYIRSLSNSELLSILDQPENYLPEAIEFAKQEMAARQLTEDDVTDVRSYRLENERKHQLEKEKFILPLQRSLQNLVLTFHPASEIPTLERSIRLITIVFGAIAIYQVYSQYRNTWYFVLGFNESPFISTIAIATFALLPIAIPFFWKRKTVGWILLTTYVTYTTTVGLTEFVTFPKYYISHSGIGFETRLLFSIAAIWVLCKENLREVFKVTKDAMLKTILFTAVLTVLLMIIIGMRR